MSVGEITATIRLNDEVSGALEALSRRLDVYNRLLPQVIAGSALYAKQDQTIPAALLRRRRSSSASDTGFPSQASLPVARSGEVTTRYLSIDPQQEPFELDPDDPNRALWACNFVTFKEPSASFLREIMNILVAAGVGVENTSIFAGSLAVLPDPSTYAGPVLLLKATGGAPPVGTHNQGAGAYRRPGFEVFVHAATTQAAEAMAQAAYSALIRVRNQQVAV